MSDEKRTEKDDSKDDAVTLGKNGGTDAEKRDAGKPVDDEKTVDVKAADVKAADEKAADEKAADEKAGGDKPSVEKAATEKAATEKADTEKAETEQTADSDTGSAGRKGVPKALAGALVAVAVVLAVVVGWLAYGKVQDNAAEAARTDALKVAEEQAVAMLAYDYTNVDDQLATAADGLTGDFRDEYLNLMNNVIAPGAKEKQISVQVNVQASSVVSADPDHVVTLLFLNQITTSSENPEAVSSGSRVRVELENQDGRWLVSRLTPI